MSKTLKERAAELKMKEKSQRVVSVGRGQHKDNTAFVTFFSPLSDGELRDFHEFVKTWKPS